MCVRVCANCQQAWCGRAQVGEDNPRGEEMKCRESIEGVYSAPNDGD